VAKMSIVRRTRKTVNQGSALGVFFVVFKSKANLNSFINWSCAPVGHDYRFIIIMAL